MNILKQNWIEQIIRIDISQCYIRYLESSDSMSWIIQILFYIFIKKWRFIRTCNAREIKEAVSIAKLPRTWRPRPFPKMSAGTRNSGGKESCLFLNRRKRMGTLRKNSNLAKLPILDKDWQRDREHWSILTLFINVCVSTLTNIIE